MDEAMGDQQVTCIVCEDLVNKAETHKVAEYNICNVCFDDNIKPQFHAALEHEHLFPVRIGSVELQASNYVHSLGEEFLKLFKRRTFEYRTPQEKRIVCQQLVNTEEVPAKGAVAARGKCFALSFKEAARLRKSGKEVTPCGAMVSSVKKKRERKMVACYRCRGWTCAYCDRALEHFGQEHDDCVRPKIEAPDLDDQGQVRSVDYQLCPRCHIPIYLVEACNHIKCTRCNTDLCYICGEPTKGDSGHWNGSTGNCPQWGSLSKKKRRP